MAVPKRVEVSGRNVAGTPQASFSTGGGIFEQLSNAAQSISSTVSTELENERKEVELNKADTRNRAAFEHIQGIAEPEGANEVERNQRELLSIEADGIEYVNTKLADSAYMTNTDKDTMLSDLREHMKTSVNGIENFTGHTDQALYGMHEKMAAALAGSQAKHKKRAQLNQRDADVMKSYRVANLQPIDVRDKIGQAVAVGWSLEKARDVMMPIIAEQIRANPNSVDKWESLSLDDGEEKLSKSDPTVRQAVADAKNKNFKEFQRTLIGFETDLYIGLASKAKTRTEVLEDYSIMNDLTRAKFGVNAFSKDHITNIFTKDVEAAIRIETLAVNKRDANIQQKFMNNLATQREGRAVEKHGTQKEKDAAILLAKEEKKAFDAETKRLQSHMVDILAYQSAGINRAIKLKDRSAIADTFNYIQDRWGDRAAKATDLKQAYKDYDNRFYKGMDKSKDQAVRTQAALDLWDRSQDEDLGRAIKHEGFSKELRDDVLKFARTKFADDPAGLAAWVGHTEFEDPMINARLFKIANPDETDVLPEEYIETGMLQFNNLTGSYKRRYLSKETVAAMSNLSSHPKPGISLNDRIVRDATPVTASRRNQVSTMLRIAAEDEYGKGFVDLPGSQAANLSAKIEEYSGIVYEDQEKHAEDFLNDFQSGWFPSSVGLDHEGSFEELKTSLPNYGDGLPAVVDQVKTYMMVSSGDTGGRLKFDSVNNWFQYLDSEGVAYAEEGRSHFSYDQLMGLAFKGREFVRDAEISGENLGLGLFSSGARKVSNALGLNEEGVAHDFGGTPTTFEQSGVMDLLITNENASNGTSKWGTSGEVGARFPYKENIVTAVNGNGDSYSLDVTNGISEDQEKDLFMMSMHESDRSLAKQYGKSYELVNDTGQRFLSLVSFRYPFTMTDPKIDSIFKESESTGVDPTLAIYNHLLDPATTQSLDFSITPKDIENTSNYTGLVNYQVQLGRYTTFIKEAANRLRL